MGEGSRDFSPELRRDLVTRPLLKAWNTIGLFDAEVADQIVNLEGRPLREGASLPKKKRQASFDYGVCPYSDSRQNHKNPMNLSALQQIAGHWDGVLDVLALVADLQKEKFELDGIDASDFLHLTSLAICAPVAGYLSGTVGQRALSPVMASVYKAAAGFKPVAIRTVEDAIAGIGPTEPTPEMVYSAADQNGTLIGGREVCAGPPNMIIEAGEALFGNRELPSTARDAATLELKALGLTYPKLLEVGAPYANHAPFDWLFTCVARLWQLDFEHNKAISRVGRPRRRLTPLSIDDRTEAVDLISCVLLLTEDAQHIVAQTTELIRTGPWSAPDNLMDALRALDSIQKKAFRQSENGMRTQLGLEPVDEAVFAELRFVDLTGLEKLVSESRATSGYSFGRGLLKPIAKSRRLSAGLCIDDVMERLLVRGDKNPLKIRPVIAEALGAYVEALRKIAHLLPDDFIERTTAEEIAADIQATLLETCDRLPPHIAESIANCARELDPDLSHLKGFQFRQNFVGEMTHAWSLSLPEIAGRKDLRAIFGNPGDGRTVVWYLQNVLTHKTAHVTVLASGETLLANLEAVHSPARVETGEWTLLGRDDTPLYHLAVLGPRQDPRIFFREALLLWESLRPRGILALGLPRVQRSGEYFNRLTGTLGQHEELLRIRGHAFLRKLPIEKRVPKFRLTFSSHAARLPELFAERKAKKV